jgi:hypothetical protein
VKVNPFSSNAAKRSHYERDDTDEIPLNKLEAVASIIFEECDQEYSLTHHLSLYQLPTQIFGPDSLQARL